MELAPSNTQSSTPVVAEAAANFASTQAAPAATEEGKMAVTGYGKSIPMHDAYVFEAPFPALEVAILTTKELTDAVTAFWPVLKPNGEINSTCCRTAGRPHARPRQRRRSIPTPLLPSPLPDLGGSEPDPKAPRPVTASRPGSHPFGRPDTPSSKPFLIELATAATDCSTWGDLLFLRARQHPKGYESPPPLSSLRPLAAFPTCPGCQNLPKVLPENPAEECGT